MRIFILIFISILWNGAYSAEMAPTDTVMIDTPSVATDTTASRPAQVDTVAAESGSLVRKAVRDLKTATPSIEWSLTAARIFWSLVFLVLGYLAIRFTGRLLGGLAERWPNNRIAFKSLVPMVHIFGWILVLFFIVKGVLNPPIATLLALTASAGIAIGFASQDILKNIFGGILILFDRPFNVGDKIEVGKYYGEVTHIGLRSVRLVTPDDSAVSVPNGAIVNDSVSNANSGEPNCQVVAEFFLPLVIDIQQVEEIALRAAAVSPYVYLEKPITVLFRNEVHQGRSLLKMRLKAYVMDLRYEFIFGSNMTKTVLQELQRKGLLSTDTYPYVDPAFAGKPIAAD